ncbi:CD63 antigen [Bicyclus anynana]|uniref:Tetraspanin n=1 Tax=Bicyclus anynana TaxID=110368 RepID=A0A6J1N1S5_BICAN|nr:CD63 antigen [Bicyclus anynana]XP_023941806.1 CD63 antigen [Bicyclus anynana]
MAIGAGMSCVKYLLFSFNLLFAITGLIILIVGAKSEINAHPYVDLTDESFYTSAPVILIIVGLIVFVVAFFGCCGAVKENHCMIVTFSVFLLLIFIAELAVGIAGYVKHTDLETSLMRSLNDSLKHYNDDPAVRQNFDIIQTDLQCCGINGYKDWESNGIPIPNTCCAGQEVVDNKLSNCTVSSPTLHQKGCLDEILVHLKPLTLLLGGVGVGIAFVQLLGVIFACCLARSIRSQYETV